MTSFPENWYEPLLLPGILTFFGVVIWLMGFAAERQQRRAHWKWVAMVLFVLAAYVGYGFYSRIFDFTYQRWLRGQDKLAWAHILAFYAPLVCAAVALAWQGWEWISRRALVPKQRVPSSDVP